MNFIKLKLRLSLLLKIGQCIILIAFVEIPVHSQILSKEMWREDILQLKDILQKNHVNLYHHTNKVNFDNAFKSLLNQIVHLNEKQILIEIAKIVALAGDGHTSFDPATSQEKISFNSYPVCLYPFEEGLYCISAPNTIPDISGLRLLSIDDTPIQNVRTKLIPYIQRDNEEEINYTYPYLIENASLLFYAGITKKENEAKFSFDDHGQKVEKWITALPDSSYRKLKWIAARKSIRDIAAIRNLSFLFSNSVSILHLKDEYNYWTQIFDSSKTVFLQYNTCWDQKNRLPFKDFVNKEVFSFLDKNHEYKLVIDLRYNPGGEPATLAPLIEGIRLRSEHFKIYRPIVLVGTRTYSAAATNVLQLKDSCNAILMGQTSRARPNSPSEGRDFVLKHSGCIISISTQMVSRSPRLGSIMKIPLDKKIPLSIYDYLFDVDKTFLISTSINSK